MRRTAIQRHRGNFLAGRTFSSCEDLNERAREWCDKVDSIYEKHIRAVHHQPLAARALIVCGRRPFGVIVAQPGFSEVRCAFAGFRHVARCRHADSLMLAIDLICTCSGNELVQAARWDPRCERVCRVLYGLGRSHADARATIDVKHGRNGRD
jgi:hypothetical protein